jgi:hypothetical protein
MNYREYKYIKDIVCQQVCGEYAGQGCWFSKDCIDEFCNKYNIPKDVSK